MVTVWRRGILEIRLFNSEYSSGDNVRYLAKMRGDRSNNCWDVATFFDFSKWRPSTIFDFKKIRIFTVSRLETTEMRHCAQFREDR